MKKTDIQIGDFLTFEDCLNDEAYSVIKVTGILQDSFFARIDDAKADDELDYEGVVGIPLTAEILEKNGFKKSDLYEVWKIINPNYELRITPWRVGIIFLEEDWTNEKEYSYPRPNCVHELQHAFRLCGIEKEIVV